VCDDCWDRRGRELATTLALWEELHNHLAPGASGLSESISRPAPGPRPPVNDAVLNALQEVPASLLWWANTARILRGQPTRSAEGKRWGYVLQESVATLTAIDEELHYQAYAVDYLSLVFRVHSQMVQLAGRAKLIHRLHAPCPECGRRELIRHNGEDRVLCTRCGSKWSRPEYDRMVAIELQSRRRA